MNVADLLDFLSCFGTVIGDSGFNPLYDFDKSGAITSSDLLAFLAEFVGGVDTHVTNVK